MIQIYAVTLSAGFPLLIVSLVKIYRHKLTDNPNRRGYST